MTTTTHHDTTRHTTFRIDLWMLGHHLSVARARYAEDEAVMEQAGHTALAGHFAQLAQDCRTLEVLLQEAEDVQVSLVGDTLYLSGQVWE